MSIISLENQVYLNLLIDNHDVPTAGQFLDEVQIIEDVSQVVPTMLMIVNDTNDIFSDSMALTDANVFDMTIGTSPADVSGEEQNMNKVFRMFGYKGKRFQSGYKYQISGLYDIPKFTHNIASAYYNGTTSDVMRLIARECELDPMLDVTEDSQVWFNINETLMKFSRELALHSYIPEGLMLHCITSDKSLWYKNVVNVLNNEPSATFTATNKPTDGLTVFPIIDWEPSSGAGFMNSWVNYGYNLSEPKLDDDMVDHNTVTLNNTNGGFAAINKDVQGMLEYTRKDYAPIDCGNTHLNYWQAYHNNLRRMALFSQKLTVMIASVTDINLLESVQVEIANAKTGNLTSYSGKYLVTGKKTIIRGTRYSEVFELARPTYPINGLASLVG